MKPKIKQVKCNNPKCVNQQNGQCTAIKLIMELKYYGKTVCKSFKQ